MDHKTFTQYILLSKTLSSKKVVNSGLRNCSCLEIREAIVLLIRIALVMNHIVKAKSISKNKFDVIVSDCVLKSFVVGTRIPRVN